MKKRELSDLQRAFLYHLMGEAKGDFAKAKVMAGYAETTPTAEIVRSLRDEIIDAAKDVLVLGVNKAAHAIVDQIDNPNTAGASISARAALEVLDRVGVSKPSGDITLKVPEGGLVILPAKQVNPYDDKPSTDIPAEHAEA